MIKYSQKLQIKIMFKNIDMIPNQWTMDMMSLDIQLYYVVSSVNCQVSLSNQVRTKVLDLKNNKNQNPIFNT